MLDFQHVAFDTKSRENYYCVAVPVIANVDWQRLVRLLAFVARAVRIYKDTR